MTSIVDSMAARIMELQRDLMDARRLEDHLASALARIADGKVMGDKTPQQVASMALATAPSPDRPAHPEEAVIAAQREALFSALEYLEIVPASDEPGSDAWVLRHQIELALYGGYDLAAEGADAA